MRDCSSSCNLLELVELFCLSLEFFSGCSQVVVVDGSSSASVDVVSGDTQGSVFGTLLLLVYTSELFSLASNTLRGYADGTIPTNQKN